MNRTRIILAPHAATDPPRFLLLDEFGEIVGRGEIAIGAPPPSVPTRDVLVVPGTEAVARWLYLPTRNDQQARAAASLQLGDQLALAGEELHIALGPVEAGDHRLVVVVGRNQMQAWLSAAALHGVRPEVVIPDHLVLASPDDGEPLIGATLGPTLAVRGWRLAMSLEPDLAPVVLGARDLRPVADRELDRMLGEMTARPAINLLQGAFGPASGYRLGRPALRRLAILGSLAVLSPLVLLAGEGARHETAARRIEARTAARVAAVLPKGVRITDPVEQAAARLDQLQLSAGGGPVALSAGLFAALETMDMAQLESLVLSPDGSMRARLSYANISDIEVMRAAMKRDGVMYREEGVREEGGRVISDVIFGARP